jgi:hypothetical protein
MGLRGKSGWGEWEDRVTQNWGHTGLYERMLRGSTCHTERAG